MSIGFEFEMRDLGRCPVCRAAGAEEAVRVPMPLGGEAKYVRCGGCGAVYLDPAPSKASIEAFYREIYMLPEYRKLEGFAVADPRQELAGTAKYMELLANEVEEHAQPPGRLLDAGCAFGGFLFEAAMRGWDVAGVEPSLEAAEFCRSALSLDVRGGGLEEAGFADGGFDVITMWDVLEHFERPVAALRRAARLAKPGAMLFLTTPNPSSPAALLMKEQWIGWKPPTHLCLFDFQSLPVLLKRTGWAPLRLKGCGIYPGQLTAAARKE